jgi:metal-responsive CopG/Arc/MetJ family transcriptional regulator
MRIHKTKIVVFRLTEKEINLLDAHAKKHEQSRSEFVRTHFINLLNNYNEKANNKV